MYIESPNKLAKPLSDTNYDHLFHFAGGHKAGMQDMDRKKQSEIIYEMSRNSLYFKNAIGKDSKTDEKISAMSTVISSVKQDLPRLNELRSKVLNDLSLCESKRNLGRICCVLDMVIMQINEWVNIGRYDNVCIVTRICFLPQLRFETNQTW